MFPSLALYIMSAKYLNFLALSAIVFLACTFSPTPVAALSVDSHGLHARHAHIGQAFAKRAPKRCKARSPQAGGDPTTSSPPAATPANPNQNTPAPPATTPATQPPPYSGGKVCVALSQWDGPALDLLHNFQLGKSAIYYNWTPQTQTPDPNFRFGYEFIPMFKTDDTEGFKKTVVPGYSSHVLGNNEPDHIQMPAGTVADLWKANVLPLKKSGYQLVSPALTSAPNSIQWMRDFIAICGGECVDKIALHWYGFDANEFIKYLQMWYAEFGRPIWVTEFACTGFPKVRCPNMYEFSRAVKGFMDNTPWVEHYCPFVVSQDMKDVDEQNRLVYGRAELSDLAKYYFG
jgi:hypothetical protein